MLQLNEIGTGDAHPIEQAPRPVLLPMHEEVQRLLRDLLDRKVIQESSSSWCISIVLARKKNESIQFCVDFRALNKLVRTENYLSHTDSVLHSVGVNKGFPNLISLRNPGKLNCVGVLDQNCV